MRHGLMPIDRVMIEWLQYYKIAFVIVLTKSDKLSKNQIGMVKSKINIELPGIDVYTFSALKKTGRENIINLLEYTAG